MFTRKKLKTKNNEFYLNHSFDKSENLGGWIFADCKNKFNGTDKNIVIYGHNMKDNSMFGTMQKILNPEWYNNEENTNMFEPKGELKINQILDISQPFEIIFEQTLKDRKKDFRRNSIENIRVIQETDIRKFIKIQKSNHSFTENLEMKYFQNFLTNKSILNHLMQF